MSTVTVDLDLPTGTTPTGAKVQVWLAGTNGQRQVGYVAGKQIVGEYNVNLTDAGTGTLDLVGNDLIEPSGTVWGVRIKLPHGPNPDVFYLDVPSTGGPYTLEDVLAEAPGPLPSAALAGEITRAEAAETALGVRIDDEETARGDADTALAAAIAAEASRATAAEATKQPIGTSVLLSAFTQVGSVLMGTGAGTFEEVPQIIDGGAPDSVYTGSIFDGGTP